MSEKATATAAPEKTSRRSHEIGRGGGSSARLVSENPFAGLQQTLGNQAMLRLLDGGIIQAKLRVSQPGDADEQEADRVAEKVVSASHAPKIQRKCACAGGAPCAKCASEDEETIHRSAAAPLLRVPELSIQRAPEEKSATPEEPPAKTKPHHHAAHPVIVEDDAEKVEPHQMRKSQFLTLLRTSACATADAVLMSVGKSTKGCPYIEKWLAHYEKQSSQHIEAAMRKYAPETARARSAHEAIRLLLVRVQKAALSWAKTGKVDGLPPEMADAVTGQKSLLEKVHDFASTGVAGAIFGFIGGKGKKEESGAGAVMRKARAAESAPAHDAASVKSQLGSGHSLDSRVQGQMSSAFGYDFSGVRVHTDSNAAKLSADLQARAFTIGNDVAFSSGEYKPGTLIGDALIAHELAHVVQQSGTSAPSGPQRKSQDDDNSLEQDADRAAMGALISTRAAGRKGISNLGRTLVPHAKAGLRLSRCKEEKDAKGIERLKVCIRPIRIADDDGTHPTTLPAFADAPRIWNKCCIDVSVTSEVTVKGTRFKEIEDGGSGAPLTAEERELFTNAGSPGGCVNVAIVDTIRRGANAGKNVAGGATTKNAGAADAAIIAVEGLEPSIIAHELGHAMGYQQHGPAGTVMEPSGAPDKPEKDGMDPVICDQVRKYTGATASGKKDCAVSP